MVITGLKLKFSVFFMLEMTFSLCNSIGGTLKSTFYKKAEKFSEEQMSGLWPVCGTRVILG